MEREPREQRPPALVGEAEREAAVEVLQRARRTDGCAWRTSATASERR
jgi:hypothetical protein